MSEPSLKLRPVHHPPAESGILTRIRAAMGDKPEYVMTPAEVDEFQAMLKELFPKVQGKGSPAHEAWPTSATHQIVVKREGSSGLNYEYRQLPKTEQVSA